MWSLNAQHLITYNLIEAKSPTPNLFSFCEYEYFDRMYICVPSECLVLCRGQKQVMDTLKLGLQMIMNHRWVLGTEPGSTARATSSLHH